MIRKLALALALGLAATQVQAADKLTVLLEWFVNPDHAPLVVAKERGLFEKAGLDVELLPPADPSIVPRAVASGQAEVGIHYQPNLYLDHAAGVNLVRFGTLWTSEKDLPAAQARTAKTNNNAWSIVGGRTVFWGGCTPRFRDEDFADWPYDADEMRSWYVRAEQLIGMSGGASP